MPPRVAAEHDAGLPDAGLDRLLPKTWDVELGAGLARLMDSNTADGHAAPPVCTAYMEVGA